MNTNNKEAIKVLKEGLKFQNPNNIHLVIGTAIDLLLQDNEDTMSKAKELFEMVYQWGRVGVVTNEKAPAFQQIVTELVREKKTTEPKNNLP